MGRITLALVVAFVSHGIAHAQAISVEALKSKCDEAAASPADANRPGGVPGVPLDKLDPKVAIAACEAASKAAPDDLHIAYQLGRAYGEAKSYEAARGQYEKANRALNYPAAANNLAKLYLEGLGVAPDLPRGVALLDQAARGGLVIAMSNLGIRYRTGGGVAKDYQIARDWLQKAAAGGDAVAMNELGLMAERGEGVAPNMVLARQWYQKAADADNTAAISRLGWMYLNGEGGPRDYVQAKRLFQVAAARGDGWAQFYLGLLYQNGWGIKPDREEARRWYEKATRSKNAEAAKKAAENIAALGAPQGQQSPQGDPTNSGAKPSDAGRGK